jgi:hypothetical protein
MQVGGRRFVMRHSLQCPLVAVSAIRFLSVTMYIPFSSLNSWLEVIDQIFTVVSAEQVARYLPISQLENREERKKIPHLTSGLRRHRVRYLLCAWNFVTAWKRGKPKPSSLIFHT